VGRNQVQLPLDRETEIVEVEIVQVVVEGVLNFLTNLKEAKQQEGREGRSWNSNPAKLAIYLELKSWVINLKGRESRMKTHGQEKEVQPK